MAESETGSTPRLDTQTLSLGDHSEAVRGAAGALDRARAGERLWAKDATLWKDDPAAAPAIRNRIGWLDSPGAMTGRVGEFASLAEEARGEGFAHAVLLGMGGSSLCPEVLSATFGSRPGFPALAVLDSTDPAWVLATGRAARAARSLYVVASKSGTTIEVSAFQRYFTESARAALGGSWAGHFAAITDPDTALARQAAESGFRRVCLNPPDIGGRYSALSAFGLVPAALIGIDVAAFLEHALVMVRACGPAAPAAENPGLALGAALGTLARRGRDKLTFVLSPSIGGFGLWAEQLVAESTGKEGRGIVPVEGEPLGPPGVYGADRVFVSIRLDSEADSEIERRLGALENAGHPIVRIGLASKLDLAQEFFRWEVATVVASRLLGVNPFDEPNVKEAKERTGERLRQFEKDGRLDEAGERIWSGGEIGLYADAETARETGGRAESLGALLAAHLGGAKPGDYVALMAYLHATDPVARSLGEARLALRDRLRVATTLGYGPRFLHSTGQLHKGGPPAGRFLQITADAPEDAPIPGERYGFAVLERAQALGDFEALASRGRRVLRLHLGRDVPGGLAALGRAIDRVPGRRD